VIQKSYLRAKKGYAETEPLLNALTLLFQLKEKSQGMIAAGLSVIGIVKSDINIEGIEG
jgi:hypothetical protein